MIYNCFKCKKCNSKKSRDLDCQECREKGIDCPLVICCDCGATIAIKGEREVEIV